MICFNSSMANSSLHYYLEQRLRRTVESVPFYVDCQIMPGPFRRVMAKALEVSKLPPRSGAASDHEDGSRARAFPAPRRARLRAAAPLLLGPGGCACALGGREQVRCAAGTGWGRAGPEPPPPSRPPQWRSAGLAAGDRPRLAEMSSTAAYYLLSTLGGYLVTSFLLLKYPTLLHQRKKQRFLSKHISHRGGEGVSGTRWRKWGSLFGWVCVVCVFLPP